MRVLTSFDDRAPVPWANGAGETTELVSITDSEALTPHLRPWRLSIARLERPGPFSALPRMDRTLLPTSEVVLTVDGTARRVPERCPMRFHGEQAVVLTDVAEPCFAVNLMVVEDARGPEPDADSRRRLSMIGPRQPSPPRLAGQPCFVLTLDAAPHAPRFQLFELSASELPHDHLGLVILH